MLFVPFVLENLTPLTLSVDRGGLPQLTQRGGGRLGPLLRHLTYAKTVDLPSTESLFWGEWLSQLGMMAESCVNDS